MIPTFLKDFRDLARSLAEQAPHDRRVVDTLFIFCVRVATLVLVAIAILGGFALTYLLTRLAAEPVRLLAVAVLLALAAWWRLSPRNSKGGLEGSGELDDSPVRPHHQWYLPIKATLDFLFALLIAIPATPIVILAAAVVKLTSPGSAFYRQMRVGKHGRVFALLKLRTMVDNAEAMTGAVWASECDPRVTPFGRFLRESHIDEFPQLINVLLGHMSLVGPRSERPEFMSRLQTIVPRYAERLAVRPGITGLTQLRLPPDTDPKGVHKKLMYDLYYIRHVQPWLDIRITAYTGNLVLAALLKSMIAPLRPLFELPTWKTVTNAQHVIEIRSPSCGTTDRELEEPYPAITNAFAVTVEDYYQRRGFFRHLDANNLDYYERRIVESTHRIVDMLDVHNVRATFFVSGWIAGRRPGLLRYLRVKSHEIGIQTPWHLHMARDQFRDDLRQSITTVEDIAGVAVKVHRAEGSAITGATLWALDVLLECGIEYDSSISQTKRFPYHILREGGGLWEFPPSVHRLAQLFRWKVDIPIGGEWLWRCPPRLILRWLRHINRANRQPFIMNIEPSRILDEKNASRLELLLSSFQFNTLTASLTPWTSPHSPYTASEETVPIG